MTSFETLTPDVILTAVENATGFKLTNLALALPSYINRVYELRAVDNTKLIVKFYRPGRWSRETILDEHRFIADCSEAEIPVVPALTLNNGSTIAEHENILFSLFSKRAGRQFEINNDDDWLRAGSLVGRLHLCGRSRAAQHRITIDPRLSTLTDIEFLCDSVVPGRFRDRFKNISMQLIDVAAPMFEGHEKIRIHGDCHRGNILDRIGEGLLLIDFDDMAMGPPVQDLWLLLPDRAAKSAREIGLFLRGYERFMQFDRANLRCIEPLRAMRMIYFLAWCSRQIDDFQFKKLYPDWGSDKFWQHETADLQEQLGFVMEAAES